MGGIQLFYVWSIEMEAIYGGINSECVFAARCSLLELLQCLTDTYIMRRGAINYFTSLFLVIGIISACNKVVQL